MFWSSACVLWGGKCALASRRALAVLLAITVASSAMLAGPAADKSDRHGLVVAVSPTGAEVGRDILLKGGNAVDAAVATAFTMAVTYPAAGNIGGGGFMVIYPGNKTEPVVIDYRETAPAAAHKSVFAKGESWYTHKAVGVPGSVRGLYLAHSKFGKLPWKDVVAPAVKLAEEGFDHRWQSGVVPQLGRPPAACRR